VSDGRLVVAHAHILKLYFVLGAVLRATACNAKRVFATAEASVRPSVRLSVTLLYCVKRIMKSSLWATARTLVSNEVILVPLGEEIPLERGRETRVPPLRNRYFTAIGSLCCSSVTDVMNSAAKKLHAIDDDRLQYSFILCYSILLHVCQRPKVSEFPSNATQATQRTQQLQRNNRHRLYPFVVAAASAACVVPTSRDVLRRWMETRLKPTSDDR